MWIKTKENLINMQYVHEVYKVTESWTDGDRFYLDFEFADGKTEEVEYSTEMIRDAAYEQLAKIMSCQG